ncbi:MAG: hypothetical protein H6626_05720 [Pseudobdellovibrionaceae bacterium]|nr:MAG: hypothetical protein H6626_05720 [Pseudobdellovibrionaceae bacterium]
MWWRSVALFLSVSSGIFSTSPALAQSLAFSRNPRTFETVQSSLFIKGMAHSCLAIKNIPDGMPCNPANVPLQKKPKLGIELLLSNGYSSLNNVRKLIKGEVSDELVDTLFSEGKIIQIEANAELDFQSNLLNARYTPLTVKGLSVVRNEANPDVELSVMEEKGFMFQTGIETFDNLFLGVQARFVERKFIRQQFKLISLGTTAGRDALKAKEQTATYIEPGATWILAKKWQPRVSLLVANLGSVSQEYDELKVPVDVQFGFGISPPVKWGELEISLEYKSLSYEEETDFEKLRFGGSYNFGAMNLVAGLDANGISGGIFYALDQIDAGVLFSTTKLTNEDEDFFTQTVYVQLGWRI